MSCKPLFSGIIIERRLASKILPQTVKRLNVGTGSEHRNMKYADI